MSQTHLIVGPPGTGKTYELTRQAARASEAHSPSDVAILSLTRTAAHNVAGRTNLPYDNVGTLHSACFRGLGCDRDDIADSPKHLRAFNDAHPMYGLSSNGAPDPDEKQLEDNGAGGSYGDLLRANIEARRQRLQPVAQWPTDERELHETWTDYKTQTGTLDFTDLLERARDELPTHPLAPRVLLVDEAQDHSALELALVRQWATSTEHTVLAGDPDQAIFSFRGASPENLMAAEYATTRILERSRRVPAAVHALATSWLAHDTDHEHAAYAPRYVNPDDETSGIEPGRARRLDAILDAPSDLVDDAVAQAAAGRSVMILATCGYMLAPVVHELRSRGEPFHNPYRPTAGAWNPLAGAGRLQAFLAPDPAGANRMWTWDDLRLFTDPMAAKDVLHHGAKTRILQRCKTEASFGQKARDVTVTMPELHDLAPATTIERLFDLDVAWWAEHLRATERGRLQYTIDVHARHGLGALSDKPAIVVGTVHSIKGGEADVVYLAPDLSRKATYQGWYPDPAARAAIRRLIYVGLTRAREELVLLAPSGPEHPPLHELEIA